MPRPYRARAEAAVSLNAGCVSCHADVAASWRSSRHKQAFVNSAFQTSFAIEPNPFCQGCHAPESDATRPPSNDVADLGVGCVTCHVTEDGAVLAAPSVEETARAPHPLRRSTDFAGPRACAGCHEFRFPGKGGDEAASFMQTTVREHASSPASSAACATCHMPKVKGRASHAFTEMRDEQWLRDQLVVRAARDGYTRVKITLAQRAPGHAFPTGDLFRRLAVGCELVGPDGAILARDVRYLARHFELTASTRGRELVRDDRLFDRPVVVELSLDRNGAPSRGVVRFWVRYQRVATAGTGLDPAAAPIESEVLLHAGDLP
jgi:hypothetical protein